MDIVTSETGFSLDDEVCASPLHARPRDMALANALRSFCCPWPPFAAWSSTSLRCTSRCGTAVRAHGWVAARAECGPQLRQRQMEAEALHCIASLSSTDGTAPAPSLQLRRNGPLSPQADGRHMRADYSMVEVSKKIVRATHMVIDADDIRLYILEGDELHLVRLVMRSRAACANPRGARGPCRPNTASGTDSRTTWWSRCVSPSRGTCA